LNPGFIFGGKYLVLVLEIFRKLFNKRKKWPSEQLKSKEPWFKAKDGESYYDLRPDKANAIRGDVIGTLLIVPFVIAILISIFMVFLYFFN